MTISEDQRRKAFDWIEGLGIKIPADVGTTLCILLKEPFPVQAAEGTPVSPDQSDNVAPNKRCKSSDGSQLKECPFCGGKPYLHDPDKNPAHETWVSCQSCQAASLTRSNKSAAIAAWNTRHTPDNGSQLREVVEKLIGMHAVARAKCAEFDAYTTAAHYHEGREDAYSECLSLLNAIPQKEKSNEI